MSRPPAASETRAAPRRELTLFDCVSIIVGIIIGASIYRTGSNVAQQAPTVTWLIGLWLLGAGLSLLGALCYAELATAYPREGGDYVYLTRAFGPWLGFLFAWCQLWIVRPGSIGMMAFAFAEYANQIWPQASGKHASLVLVAYAAAAVLLLTLVNMLGVRQSKWTQNVLTVAKVLGLSAIVVVGFCHTTNPSIAAAAGPDVGPTTINLSGFGLAMVFVLLAYGGWNEMAFVAAEVKNPIKNIRRALLIGTASVAVIYVVVNLAFVHALGLTGARSPTVAADVLRLALGPAASIALSLLICISALGAINGEIFTGSRIYYAMGTDHRLYSWLGRWNARRGAPLASLLIQGVITLSLVVGFGLTQKGFESMVLFTTPGFWCFLMLVAVSVFILRRRDPTIERPVRVPLYPLTPIIFCMSSGFMVYTSIDYALRNRSWEAFWAIGILAVGVLLVVIQSLRGALRPPRTTAS